MYKITNRVNVVENKKKRFMGTKYLDIYILIDDVARYKKMLVK
jgi:hypothetical protein